MQVGVEEAGREFPIHWVRKLGAEGGHCHPGALLRELVVLLVLVFITVLVTSLISGILGMAGGFILMGVLSSFLPVALAMVTHGFVQAWANGLRAVSLWKHIAWRGTGLFFLGAACAIALLISTRWVPSKAVLFISLGLIPFIALVLKRFELNFERPWHAFGCGFLVNGMQVTAGVGGPALDVFFVRTQLNRFQVVATKSITQVLSHGIKTAYFWNAATSGDTKMWDLWFWPTAVGVAWVGTNLGVNLLQKISDKQFQRWTQAVVLALGAIYLFKGIWLMAH